MTAVSHVKDAADVKKPSMTARCADPSRASYYQSAISRWSPDMLIEESQEGWPLSR